MYSDKSNTIGEKRSIFVGLMIARLNKSVVASSEASFDVNLEFHVSLRSFLAFASSIAGWYVSRMSTKDAIVTAPDCFEDQPCET